MANILDDSKKFGDEQPIGRNDGANAIFRRDLSRVRGFNPENGESKIQRPPTKSRDPQSARGAPPDRRPKKVTFFSALRSAVSSITPCQNIDPVLTQSRERVR
jgi:hypothetical protein